MRSQQCVSNNRRDTNSKTEIHKDVPLVLGVQVDQSGLNQALSVLSLKIFSFPDDGVHWLGNQNAPYYEYNTTNLYISFALT